MFNALERQFGSILCLTFDDLYTAYLSNENRHLEDPFFEQHYISRKEQLPNDITFDMYVKMYTIHDVITRASMSGCMLAGEHIERLVDTVVAPNKYPLFLEYVEASNNFHTIRSYAGMTA